MPPAFVELAVGLSSALLLFLIRVPLVPLTGDRTAYAFNYLAIVLAAVLAGWRSGAIALVAGQLLIWYFIIPRQFSFALADTEQLAGLIVTTIAQAVVLAVLWLYQREVDKGAAERERRLSLLDDAMREIDHRTRNNYQTVLAVIELQARRSSDEAAVKALLEVRDRIRAVADASQQLALRSGGLSEVRLSDHLCGLVGQIAKGLARPGVTVECNVDDVTAGPEAATSLAIIVNELVTNALKHAFGNDRPGQIIVTGRCGSSFELVVEDNGRGIRATEPSAEGGLGTRLVASFAKQLGGKVEVRSTDHGTAQRIVIPSLA
jgi:two-component system, sensor histidine kinase PdtaS